MHDAECDRLNLMCQTYNVSININFLLYSIRLNQIGLFVKLLAIILDSITSGLSAAFSALTPLAGHQEEHPACRNWVMRCWCGYLSGARYRLLACGSATAPENPWSFASFKPQTGFTFLLLAYSVVLEKRLLNGCFWTFASEHLQFLQSRCLVALQLKSTLLSGHRVLLPLGTSNLHNVFSMMNPQTVLRSIRAHNDKVGTSLHRIPYDIWCSW